MTREQKKQVALDLYLRTSKTLIEIGEIVDTNEKTIRIWRDKYNWEELRSAETAVKSQVISNLYKAILSLSKDETEQIKNIKEIAKLTNIIEKLSQEPTISIYIQIFQEFNEFLKNKGMIKVAQQFNAEQSIFIKTKAGVI
jgi:hypothetical protein